MFIDCVFIGDDTAKTRGFRGVKIPQRSFFHLYQPLMIHQQKIRLKNWVLLGFFRTMFQFKSGTDFITDAS